MVVVYVTTDGCTERAGKGLEDGLGLVMFVIAFGLDIEVHEGSVGETLEEMEEHLGGNVADALSVEGGLPDEPGASAKVEGHVGMTVVHGQ